MAANSVDNGPSKIVKQDSIDSYKGDKSKPYMRQDPGFN